jgi:hypothetical protein
MLYQGPMLNPGVEINTAVGGRILSDVRRSVEDVLAETIDLYYRPKSPAVQKRLVDLVLRAEEAYFGQWDPKVFAARNVPVPGELHLTGLFDETPGAAFYLVEPCLTAEGRRAYKKELIALLKEFAALEGSCDDQRRLGRIQKGLATTHMLVDTIRCAKGEA